MAGATMSRKKPTDADWSKFLKLLGISQLQLSSSSSSSGSTPHEFEKICVLITHVPIGPSAFKYWPFCRLYVVDLNNSDSDSDSDLNTSLKLEPVIYWDIRHIGRHAFVMLGTKLFMFGGLVLLNGSLRWGDGMSYYDMEKHLSSSSSAKTTTNPPLLINKESLIDGPKMSGKNKTCPYAVVMGDSKICVFGSILYIKGKESSCPNFELLCITTSTSGGVINLKWKTLPDPLIYTELNYHLLFTNCVTIKSYCVHGSCLIIKLVGLGVYGINVDHQDPKWVTLDRSEHAAFPMEGMFAMVNDEMLCNGFYVAKRDSLLQAEPIEFEVPSNRASHDLAVSPKRAQCFDDRSNAFCLAQTAFTFGANSTSSYLLVDIVKFDAALLSELGPDVEEWPKIKTNKSFTFRLPESSLSESLDIIACLPIKNAYTNNKSVVEVDQREEEEEEEQVANMIKGESKKKKKKLKMTNIMKLIKGESKKKKKKKKKLKMTNMKNCVESEVS